MFGKDHISVSSVAELTTVRPNRFGAITCPTETGWYDAPRLALHQWTNAQPAEFAVPRRRLRPRDPRRCCGPWLRARPSPRTEPSRLRLRPDPRPADRGVAVSIEPIGSTFCSPAPCSSGVTDVNGKFSYRARPAPSRCCSPPTTTSRTGPGHRRAGATVALGIVYLVHERDHHGDHPGQFSGPRPDRGAALRATSRDGSILALPLGTSVANGSFSMPVPPLRRRSR